MGTKNSGFAYVLAFIIFILYAGLRWKRLQVGAWFAVRGRSIIIGCTAFLFIMTPMLSANIIERGSPWATHPGLNPIKNRPFNVKCAQQNIKIYSLKFLFSVFPDFINPTDFAVKQSLVKKYNDFFVNKFILNDGPIECDIYNLQIIPIAWANLYDHSAGYGLLPWLILCSTIFVFIQKRLLFGVPFWLGSSFVLWVLTFCVSMKYTGDVQRYWILPVTVVTPLVALLWDYFEPQRNLVSFCFKSFCLLCIAGGVILAWNGLNENSIRGHNLVNTLGKIPPRVYTEAYSDDVRKVVKNAASVNIVHRYGYPLYEYMLMNLDATFYSKWDIIPSVTNVLSFTWQPVLNNDPFRYPTYIPIKLPPGRNDGFAYLGNAPWNAVVFVNNIPQRLRKEFPTRFFLISLTPPVIIGKNEAKSTVQVTDKLEVYSDLEFSFFADLGENRIEQLLKWSRQIGGLSLVLPLETKNVVVMTRSIYEPDRVLRTSYPFSAWDAKFPETLK